MAVKICTNCNEQYDDDAVVCKYCGQPTARADDGTAAVEKNNSKNTYLYIGIALLAVVIVIAVISMR